MKNMKVRDFFLKSSAIMMAAVLLATAVPARSVWAVPTDADTAKIAVLNAGDATVAKAYRFVKPVYDANGLKGYDFVSLDVAKLIDPSINAATDTAYKTALDRVTSAKITKEDLTKLSNGKATIEAANAAVDMAKVGTGFEKTDAPVGEYLVLITNTTNPDVIYNPMVLSNGYDATKTGAETTPKAGEVDATSNFSGGDPAATAYAKSSRVTVDKKITNDTSAGAESNDADDVAVGDEITFSVETTIPSYSEDYTDPEFEVTDKLDAEKFENISELKIQIGGEDVTDAANTYELEGGNGTLGFKYKFKSAYLVKTNNAGADARKVVITYKTRLTEKAGQNFSANINEAGIEYSNDPSDKSGKKKITDKTRHYTFSIDGLLNGMKKTTEQGGEKKIKKTHELVKTTDGANDVADVDIYIDDNGDKFVKENGADVFYKFDASKKDNGYKGEKATPVFTTTMKEPVTTTTSNIALAGAEFKLYKSEADATNKTNEIRTVTTDALGHMEMTGLDAGKYWLRESKAPAGYSMDATVHTIEIIPTYENEVLKSYKVIIDGANTSTYTATYTGNAPIDPVAGSATIDDYTVEEVEPAAGNQAATTFIKNTKLNELPSTGGMGTYAFTIVGVAVVAISGGALLAKKRRKSEEE